MIVLILLGVAVLLGIGAAFAARRANAIQSNPNFAPEDHVEVPRFGIAQRFRSKEVHHDEDPPDFEMGD